MTRLLLSAALVFVASSFAADPPPAVKEPLLDAFPSGPWQGKNAVFETKAYEAILGADRILWIQPKEEGKNAGPPVRVVFNAYFARDLRSIPRTLVSLEKKPAPAMQPKKIELAGHYEEKVRFTVTYEFGEEGVTIQGEVKDPSSVKTPTTLATAIVFPAVPAIKADATPEQADALTSGFTIKLLDAKKQAKTLRFSEFPPIAANSVLRAEVSGLWGARKIVAEGPATRKNGERVANLGNYGGQPFYKGGWYLSRGGTDKLDGGALTVRTE